MIPQSSHPNWMTLPRMSEWRTCTSNTQASEDFLFLYQTKSSGAEITYLLRNKYRLDGRTVNLCAGGRDFESQRPAKPDTALQTVRYHFNIYAGSCVALALWRGDKDVARGPRPPNRSVVLDFGLNFSRDMPKMHYFSNKFSKIAKRWGLTAPSVP